MFLASEDMLHKVEEHSDIGVVVLRNPIIFNYNDNKHATCSFCSNDDGGKPNIDTTTYRRILCMNTFQGSTTEKHKSNLL